jgi:hypothetical protein
MALVIGYIFKDRIKEGTQRYFKARMQRRLFDHKMHIYGKPQESIGWCKERFDFVNESQVPENVMKLRDRDHLTDIENEGIGEKIIRYRKRITLCNPVLHQKYDDLQLGRVTDIMRLNVFKFLQKFDHELFANQYILVTRLWLHYSLVELNQQLDPYQVN